MTRLIRVELFKIRTTRLFLCLSLATVALIGFVLVVQLAVSVEMGGLGGQVADEQDLRQLLDVGGIVGLFALVLGATAFPVEARYRTITPTLLATPVRWKVVVAKMGAYAIAGAVMMAAAELVAAVVVVGWLVATGGAVPWGPTITVALLLGPLATGMIAVMGVGIGAAIPSQVGSVLVAVGWVMLIEQLLSQLISAASPWLPFYGAFRAITADGTDPGRVLGALALAGYVAVVSLVGAVLVERRDVV